MRSRLSSCLKDKQELTRPREGKGGRTSTCRGPVVGEDVAGLQQGETGGPWREMGPES